MTETSVQEAATEEPLSASQKLSRQLSLGQAKKIEQESYEVVPKIFESLVAHERPALMEIACSPDSYLAATVQGLCQSEKAASRCAAWNNCDLSTDKGVALILQRIQIERPRHVWLSPPCGPYSPMQNVNQRNAHQCEALKQERKEALKVYLGAVSVAHACYNMGSTSLGNGLNTAMRGDFL